ncbi:MAG: hypothetical protein J0M02_18615 [Planctomycetes bacterium]|nr:hypothetical protein [Planctomycetota bacterium]
MGIPPAEQICDVYESSEDAESDAASIGRIGIAPDGKLRLVSALPEHQRRLAEIVQLMNGKDVLHQDIAPPEGTPRVSASRVVTRDAPDFVEVLCAYLETYHGLEVWR